MYILITLLEWTRDHNSCVTHKV